MGGAYFTEYTWRRFTRASTRTWRVGVWLTGGQGGETSRSHLEDLQLYEPTQRYGQISLSAGCGSPTSGGSYWPSSGARTATRWRSGCTWRCANAFRM